LIALLHISTECIATVLSSEELPALFPTGVRSLYQRATTPPIPSETTVLVTGASGFIGLRCAFASFFKRAIAFGARCTLSRANRRFATPSNGTPTRASS
jgi:hypothetical protein